MAAKGLPLGSRLIEGKIEIVESEIEKDREIPVDIRTSQIFLEIANSVSFLKLTVDSPSLHTTGYMPILDLQIKTENNQIIYKFYKKEVSNTRVILNSSAMPTKIKRITCIQEAQEHSEELRLVYQERNPVRVLLVPLPLRIPRTVQI